MKDTTFRAKAKLTGLFARAMQSKPTRLPVPNKSNQVIPAATNESAVQEASAAVSDEEVPISLDGTRSQELPKPAQEKLLTEIGALNKKIASYSEFIFKQGEEVRPEQKKQVKNLREEKEKKEKLLKRKIIEAKISQKLREKKAKVLADLKKDHPNTTSKLERLESSKNQPGSIATEGTQLHLH